MSNLRPTAAASCLALLLAVPGCAGTPVGPYGVITYELRAVNGRTLPATVGAIGDDTLRILIGRITFTTNDQAEAEERQQIGASAPRAVTAVFEVRPAGDSVQLRFPCPSNAVCSVADRVGRRPVGATLQLREQYLDGLTYEYVRRE